MKRISLAVTASVLISSVATLAWSKGTTVKLVVSGENLTSPIEITDPEIVGSFDIWTGPGVRVNGVPVHLNPDKSANPGPAFIDWPSGIQARPAGLDRYEVTFFIDGRARGEYTVVYEIDTTTPAGYIYLPGRGDPCAMDNMRLIYHGVEGNWFRSSQSWERLVRPTIQQLAVPTDP